MPGTLLDMLSKERCGPVGILVNSRSHQVGAYSKPNTISATAKIAAQISASLETLCMTMRLGRLIIYRGLISDAARTMVSARPGGRLEATDGHRKLS